MIELDKKVLDKINEIRTRKGSVSFIQIGAYDGVSFGDVANICLKENDLGIYIEPNSLIFETLKNNKKNFTNVKFLDFAIIPNKTFYHESFHVHKHGGQSSFVKALMNKEYTETGYEQIKIKSITVEELLKDYVDYQVDALFLDCEGYDHDIIKEFINYQKPEIIYFESWNTSHVNNILHDNVLTTREEIFEFLKSNGYNIDFDSINENVLSHKK